MPVALEALVITGIGGFTVRANAAVPVPVTFVAPRIRFELPAC